MQCWILNAGSNPTCFYTLKWKFVTTEFPNSIRRFSFLCCLPDTRISSHSFNVFPLAFPIFEKLNHPHVHISDMYEFASLKCNIMLIEQVAS